MSDMTEDGEICQDCEQRKYGDLIFHLLYCYDVYIVSPPCPQSLKQNGIDTYLNESIVKPLEDKGYYCYHGSRNITGGDYIIQAMSYPITIIPTTIVPVFKDKKFSNLRNLLLRPDYLERTVFLLFDASQAYPDAISKNSYSLSVHDPYLLPKLIQTIEQNRKETPLLQRKIKYEMGPYPASTVSSIPSEMCIERNSRSSLLDIFKIGRLFHCKDRMNSHPLHEEGRLFHGRGSMDCPDSRTLCEDEEEEHETVLLPQIQVQQSRCFSTAFKTDDGTYLEDLKSTTSPDVLLSHCHHHDEKISHFAARTLTKTIQKRINTFYRNISLLRFETEVRILLEKDYMRKCEINSYYEKLYFWILAAIYIRIYKCNDSDLKYHMKALTLKWFKTSTKSFEQLYQNNYLKLTISMIARIKAWPRRLEKHEAHVQMLENCISLMDQNGFRDVRRPDMSTVVEYLIQLPWDIKHIFVVVITEKIFEKKYTEACIVFFYQICSSVRDKHQETYLDVVERVTEYIQENYTKGELTFSIKLLGILWDFLKDGKRKDEKLLTILKHFFKKLLYHPVTDVRNFVAPRLFSDDVNGIDVSQLGSSCIIVDEDLLETCIREKMSLNYPDMVLRGQLPTTAENVLLFDATMADGDTLVHVLRQRTLNDILQTNSTDGDYERFQEISRALATCQGHRNIVTLKKLSANDVLPLFMVEHGKPLLQFLHKNENHLTWSQMLEILSDITSAVQHCHQNNILICDISPASFVVTSGPGGFCTTKLSNFLYSKCITHVEYYDPCEAYIEEYNSICVEGEYKQPLAAYFSAPETLKGNYFSKSTEVWMLAATFYSILLYGRQPFEELSHLQTSWFVREITSCHTPQIPGYFLPDLQRILSVNLDHKICNRMSIESVLEELDTIKSTLGAKGDEIYCVRSVCPCINPEDIQMVYRDLKGDFIEEKAEKSTRQIYRDFCRRKNRLSELVSVRMSQKARKAIKTLSHINILAVEEITTDSYTTKLVSVPFESHFCILKRNDGNIKLDKLLSYFEQIVNALQYLHSQNILHCDLRCSYIYIDDIKGTLKLGHFGRAVLLEKNQSYVLKMMPPDAVLWSANEVKTNGMYSQASDIFNLASVFWEALNTQNKILPGSQRMYENLLKPPDSWQYCMNKLMDCMKECWNINPTKRPTLDSISTIIKELKQEAQRWTDEKTKFSDHAQNEGETYEDITPNSHNTDSTMDYVWKSIVYELESGMEINTPLLYDTYENTRTVCNKARKHRGIIL
ncbi:uncharacterized protein LOC122941307 [Bufo gargarizans]|uniref:uncharacterized protein LOC122941307 n=1 Tax=Bufo gargarizans TaxID=30331 RepID=UPI001CF525C5|nr:uncharacterized protein LOC122941307 [Bufo gargarizans]